MFNKVRMVEIYKEGNKITPFTAKFSRYYIPYSLSNPIVRIRFEKMNDGTRRQLSISNCKSSIRGLKRIK